LKKGLQLVNTEASIRFLAVKSKAFVTTVEWHGPKTVERKENVRIEI